MKFKSAILYIIFLILFNKICLFGQFSISGNVRDQNYQPIIGATILVVDKNFGTVTDDKGEFIINDLGPGQYDLLVSYIGFEESTTSFNVDKNYSNVRIVLKESSETLDEVTIVAKSNDQIKREQPIKVEVISVARVLEQSTSVSELINQSSGVKVRQSAGVGSNTTININGLQGNAVRYFKDGIPTNYLGRAFNIGLVPTGSIQNIEIYKGVLPIHLGADALGGAVNIVTKNKNINFLDASYEIGSFNTHLINFNTNYNIPKTRVHVGISSYLTHSDNDYDFEIELTDFNGKKAFHEVNRFHDAITAYFTEVSFGCHDTKWADLLDVSVAYFNLKNEVQHGLRINQPFGNVTGTDRNAYVSLRYEKKLLNTIVLDLFGAYGDREATDKDLSEVVYDWYGNISAKSSSGEVQLRDQKFTGNTQVARAKLTYQIRDNIQILASSTYNSTEQVGEDPYAPYSLVSGIQPITIPSTYSKLVSGVGFNISLLEDNLKSETFLKQYYLDTESAGYWGDDDIRNLVHTSYGYGQSIKFSFDKNKFIRGSYEYATRIPEEEEFFGDNLFLLPNPELNPELSDNFNIGISTNLNKSNSIGLEINAFYRNTEDFIRIYPIGFINSINQNSDTQITKGIEAALRLAPDQTSSINLALTFQDLRRKDTKGSDRVLEGSRTPNIPYLFVNISMKKKFEQPFGLPAHINVYGNYLYTEQYFFIAAPKVLEPPIFGKSPSAITSLIPTQHQANIGLTYHIMNLPIALNLEVINLLNNELYDDFRIPKPKRNYRLKVSYRL